MLNSLSNFLINKLIDQTLRNQAAYTPSTVYVAFLIANKGIQAPSTTYAASSYMTVLTQDGQYHLYYSSAGGTSAVSAPTFPGLPNEIITDGTVTWTEQTQNLKSGAACVEPTIGVNAYARVAVTSSLANWAGTQGAGTTAVSSGTSGKTSNNNTVTFPTPTGNWAASPAVVWGIALYDAGSGGNLIVTGPISAPQSIIGTSPAPTLAATNIDLALA